MAGERPELPPRRGLTYRRPYLMPDGSVRDVYLPACDCGEKRRGPAGGVCGNCGGAIPER